MRQRRARVYTVGPQPAAARAGRLASMLLGLGAMTAFGAMLVDAEGGQTRQLVGTVDRYGMRLVGKVSTPTMVVAITHGPHAGKEVSIDGQTLAVGTTVDVEATAGRWSGELYGGKHIRARTSGPKVP